MGRPISVLGFVRFARSLSRITLVTVVLLMQAGVARPATAADLSSHTASATQSNGALRTVLRWAVKLLTWIAKVVPSARGAIEAIEELLRLLDDAKRAADLQASVAKLERRLADLEAELAKDKAPRAADARQVVRKLRAELRRAGYVSCGIAKSRKADGTCSDRTQLDKATLPE